MTSPDEPYTTALSLATVAPVTPVNKFNSAVDDVIPSNTLISPAVAVISFPEICNLVAFTSPFSPYITAFSFTIPPDAVPSSLLISVALEVTPSRIFNSDTSAVIPFNVLISAADAVTRVPPNLRPPSIPSCDAILRI